MSANPQSRRRAVREIVDYLRSDLYEHDRDYTEKNRQFHAREAGAFTCEIKPVPVDPETEMVWGSPLGWRVVIGVTTNDDIYLKIYDPPGELYKESPVLPVNDYGEGVGWLENFLP